MTAHYPFGGGAEEFLAAELAGLAECGVDVAVFPVRRQGLPRVVPDGALVAPRVSRRELPVIVFEGVRRSWTVLKIVRRLTDSPRALARNVAMIPLALVLAARFRHTGAPDHVHAHWLSHTATLAWMLHMLVGVDFSITAHRWDIYAPNLFEAKAQSAQFVRFISERGRHDFRAQIRKSGTRLNVVHLGVSLPPLPVRRRPDVEREHVFRIGAVGALLPVKGHEGLIKAVAGLARSGMNVSLEILGEGPLRDTLESVVRREGVDACVRMPGHRTHEEVVGWMMNDIDALVLPSVDLGGGVHEGVPVVLMEAMAVGIPVVATDTGSIGELVVDGLNGLLVPDKSPEALASAIAQLHRQRGLADRLAAAGRETVAREFNNLDNARRLVGLIRCEDAPTSP